jgi:hypothetical protein
MYKLDICTEYETTGKDKGLYYKGIWESGYIDPHILDLGTGWG